MGTTVCGRTTILLDCMYRNLGVDFRFLFDWPSPFFLVKPSIFKTCAALSTLSKSSLGTSTCPIFRLEMVENFRDIKFQVHFTLVHVLQQMRKIVRPYILWQND